MKYNSPLNLEKTETNETTLNKQLRKIYLDQERRRKVQDKRRKFIEKWGCICSCCL